MDTTIFLGFREASLPPQFSNKNFDENEDDKGSILSAIDAVIGKYALRK